MTDKTKQTIQMKNRLKKTFQVLSSLKLAVVVIFSLAVALSAGTIVESLYDTPTAQYWIYRSFWFHFVLILLGLNILCVALSRYPWKIRHLPFLLAHLGILILLAGSWITDQWGIDGNLRVTEGETASVVEFDTASLVVSEKSHVRAIPIRWIPPGVKFKPMHISSYGTPYDCDLKIDRFLTHADPEVSFVANTPQSPLSSAGKLSGAAAIQLKMTGGPMGVSEAIWLWEGGPGWKSLQAGPARFSLGTSQEGEVAKAGQPTLSIQPEKDGSISYVAKSSAGKKVRGKFHKGHIVGQVIQPGWKGNVSIAITDWIPDAVALTAYKPARIQYGNQAPTSAIHVVASPSADVWLGLGDRAVLHVEGHEIEIGYFPKRIVLPFSLRLEKFTVEHDEGTLNPASYASQVSVLDGQNQKNAVISMNEPLEMKDYTIYQASYEEADPRPVTSIFSINRDPGRRWKYLGSALIVLGSILLFAAKYRQAKKSKSLSVVSFSPVSEV